MRAKRGERWSRRACRAVKDTRKRGIDYFCATAGSLMRLKSRMCGSGAWRCNEIENIVSFHCSLVSERWVGAPRSSTNPGFGGSRARATRPPRRRDPSGGTWRALSVARRDCVRFCQDVSSLHVLDWTADCSCAPVFVLVVWKYRRTGGGRSKVSSRVSKYSPAESKPLTRIACRVVDRLFVLFNVALLLLEVDSHLRRVLSAGEGDALRRESGNV